MRILEKDRKDFHPWRSGLSWSIDHGSFQSPWTVSCVFSTFSPGKKIKSLSSYSSNMYVHIKICTRLGQPDWEFSMWKFNDISDTQILREINFLWFQKVKNCHFDHLSCSEFCIFGNFWHFKSEIFPKIKIQSLQNCYNSSFWRFENSYNWFHIKS